MGTQDSHTRAFIRAASSVSMTSYQYPTYPYSIATTVADLKSQIDARAAPLKLYCNLCAAALVVSVRCGDLSVPVALRYVTTGFS